MGDLGGQTLFDKIWDAHVVSEVKNGPTQLYIDRHFCHEVTSPQAFNGLRARGLKVYRPEKTTMTADHNTPTINQDQPVKDPVSRHQLDTFARNAAEFGMPVFYPLGHEKNGVVHIIGPENGFTQPGMTIVCGDSHTSTHGALGALAHGIGTSEVEHVMATQTLIAKKAKNMLVRVEGKLHPGVTAKDVMLAIIGKIGTAGGTGYTIEFAGSTIRSLSVEGRMTICNMSIEAGARAGMVAVDDTTIEYIKGRPFAPGTDRATGRFVGGPDWEQAVAYWRTLHSDPDAHFDAVVELRAEDIQPQVTWGTSPEMVLGVMAAVPDPEKEKDDSKRNAMERALTYMDLEPGKALTDIYVDKIFIGSCTNSRIEDIREAAAMLKKLGRKIAPNIKQAMVVPGSGQVKAQAEREGLDAIFKAAGFEWRQPGCSMCLAMNADRLEPGERCASTSNRNFEGRQGAGGRTHLVSPAMAAAAAVHGHFVDVRAFA